MNFPKIQSPFVRKPGNAGNYTATPEIPEDMRWVFDPDEPVIVLEKLHGTNCKFTVANGMIDVTLRDSKNKSHISTGPLEGQGKWNWHGVMNYIAAKPGGVQAGEYFGEIVGPKLQGNPHGLETHQWRDFRPHKFWSVKAFNHHPERTGWDNVNFEDWKEFIVTLKSNTFRDSGFCEGVVFHNQRDGQMAKLRKDMFAKIRA